MARARRSGGGSWPPPGCLDQAVRSSGGSWPRLAHGQPAPDGGVAPVAPVEPVQRGGVLGQGLGGAPRPPGAAAGPLDAARHRLRPRGRAAAAPAHQHDGETGDPEDHRDRHRRDAAQGGADVAQRGGARAGIGQRHGRGGVEVLPPVAGEPHLDPGMGIVGMDLVEVGDGVVAPGHVPDRLAGRDPERAQHHRQRRRDLLAEADAVAEEELVDRVGAGRAAAGCPTSSGCACRSSG